MTTRFLFPNYYKIIGWILAVPGLVCGYFILFHQFSIPGFGPVDSRNSLVYPQNTYTDELVLTVVILGLFFLAFSKEKKEDELTTRIRQNALYWAYLSIICFALYY